MAYETVKVQICNTTLLRTTTVHELRSPQRTELCGHDLAIGDVALEDTEVACKPVHAGHERLRDRRVVIRQVAADQLGDQLRFGGRKELAADLGCAGDVLPQRRLRLDDGANRRRRRLR